jgi:MOSC domain-containing protein
VAPVHVSRIGLTALKGTRHTDRASLDLTLDGPVGDRVFCLVDPARGRVVRTVESTSLLRTTVTWEHGVLTAELPTGTASGVPVGSGRPLDVDYWGRRVALEEVDGPWSAAFSAHLGRDVVLARSRPDRPSGQFVYGGSVSLVTSSSLDRLREETKAPVADASFRATFTVDTGGWPPHVEDGWAGRRLRLGEAEVEVVGGLPRCALVDRDPCDGGRGSAALGALGRYRRTPDGIMFGVHAVVTRAGRVDLADTCELVGTAVPRARAVDVVAATAGRG